LNRIDVPSFVIHGRHDISDETVNGPFFWKIPKVKWLILENSSHTPMWEERERYGKVIGDWVNAYQ
jgi:pimeloyl-ACP methyl ester carboxylesterase